MDASIMILRHQSEPEKVLYYSVFGQSFIINTILDEVVPFDKVMPYQGKNKVWEVIDLNDLTGDELNYVERYAEEEIGEIERF